MSVESTIKYYKGEWEFKGETAYGFDQLNLSITQSRVLLIFKSQGKEIERKAFPAGAHFIGEYLLFTNSERPYLFLVNANEEDMILGQQKGSFVGETLWHLKVKRKIV